MDAVLDVVRREWEDGYHRFEDLSRDRVAATRLTAQLEVVMDELRKRVGQTFTLEQLAAAYERADEWAREAVSERAATPGWPRTLAIVQDTAFYLYQRGAVDYAR
jgi:alcohol dehydrogenase class IV